MSSADEDINMAPKQDDSTNNTLNGEPNDIVTEDDLEEIESLSNNLDSLNSALDLIEQRNDNIREQLLELLKSNREIRQSLRDENNKPDTVDDTPAEKQND